MVDIRQSWGVASARHTAGCAVSGPSAEHQFDVPLGPSVVRWCVHTGTRLLQFQAHPDLITCMRMSPDWRHIVTTSYGGEVKLWSGKGWECECVTVAPMAQQHHLAWRHDSKAFIIVGNGFGSCIAMYSLTERNLELAWKVEAKSVAGQDADGSAIAVSETSPADVGELANTGKDFNYSDVFTMAEINPNSTTFAVEEKSDRSVFIHLISAGGQHLKQTELKEKSIVLLSTYNAKLEIYCIIVQGGNVLIVSATDVDVKSKFSVGYTSRSCVWDDVYLVLPSDSGKISWLSMAGERIFEAVVGPTGYIVHLTWSLSGRALWMCGFSRLCYVEVERHSDGAVKGVNPAYSISSHDISCCGVAVSDCGKWLCAGDLAGGVWVMHGTDAKYTYKTSVDASVRCLLWWGDSCVLVGCLNGKVYKWRLGKKVEEMLNFEGSVIIMRWSNSKMLLAIGLSSGVLAVYGVTGHDLGLKLVTSFTAHPPQQQNKDMRFGQLSKQAEIWSLCWSPTDSDIATCSEDQTSKIWETKEWTCRATVCGHTMAVTSVDWREDGCGLSVLATCSDDRTVRVMDGNNFKLIHALSTKDLYGWHTLTYLALHPCCMPLHSTSASGPASLLLTCTTQNGYVVVWKALSGEKVALARIHSGSVEGLAADNSSRTLVTVGGDCAVHVFIPKLIFR